eukprot:scaffold1299_cov331-Prasinococcus_capsulatus_cf.AAC.5
MLILAAAQFYPERVVSMEQGAELLQKTLGSSARLLFAIAMLCAGQSSSLTGIGALANRVLSTQFIMEGFFKLSVPGWIVRMVTRLIAILPAFLLVFIYGESIAADMIADAQVVVNFVVPFTVIPLTKFLTSEDKMGRYRLKGGMAILCWTCAVAATVLNLTSLYEFGNGIDINRPYGAALQAFVVVMVMGIYLTLSFYFTAKPVGVPPIHQLDKSTARASTSQAAAAAGHLHRRGSTALMGATVIVAVLAAIVQHVSGGHVTEALACGMEKIGIRVAGSCHHLAQLQD